MKENELIGIIGVFVLTFCLIALYHLIGEFGRHSKRFGAQTRRDTDPERDRQRNHDPHRASGKDDAWILWNPELDERAGPLKPGFPGHRETRGAWLRGITNK
ncbi:MAG: hypothetical protein ABI728_13205 [Betaproteobacteria bacterium]